jgi:tetrahydromethanopterin S-methyltransferase subunit G
MPQAMTEAEYTEINERLDRIEIVVEEMIALLKNEVARLAELKG